MTDPRRHGLRFHETGSGNPASYSAAVRAGDLIFTAGQLGVARGAPPVDFRLQATEALRRLIAAVEAAGGGLDTIVKVNGYLADLDVPPMRNDRGERMTLSGPAWRTGSGCGRRGARTFSSPNDVLVGIGRSGQDRRIGLVWAMVPHAWNHRQIDIFRHRFSAANELTCDPGRP